MAAAQGTVPQTYPDRGFRPATSVTNSEHFPLTPAHSHLPIDLPCAQDSIKGSRDATSLILILVPIAVTFSYEFLQHKA